MELATPDYIALLFGIGISLAVGVYYAYKDRNKKSLIRYHRGDRKLGALPVAISLLVTKQSSLFFLGYPAEIYAYGIQYYISTIARSLGFIWIVIISVPLFYPMAVTSVFEYLEKRHGTVILRRITMALDCLFNVMYTAIILYGASIALSSVTPIDSWVFVLGLTIIAVVYTALGGIKAVVYADVIQCVVMALSFVAVIVYGVISVGGLGNVFALNKPSGRLNLFDFNPDPLVRNSFWAVFIGSFFLEFCHIVSQTIIQRLNSTKSTSDAKKVVYIFIPMYFIVESLATLQGLVAYAYFSYKGCDPLASGRIKNPNQIIPFLVVDMFTFIPGVSGLFLAALCSASLSTLSSLFSSMSAVVTEELRMTVFKTASEVRLTHISKLLVIIISVICVGFALVLGNTEGPLLQITATVLGSFLGPVAGIFMLSIFNKKTSVKGIVTGAAAGLAFGLWLSVGANFSTGIKRTPYLSLGPVTNCQWLEGYTPSHNVTKTSLINGSLEVGILINATELSDVNYPYTTSQPLTPQIVTGLNRLYSISYNYFVVIFFAITIVVGLLASKVFKPQFNVPDNMSYSLSSICQSQCKRPGHQTNKRLPVDPEGEENIGL